MHWMLPKGLRHTPMQSESFRVVFDSAKTPKALDTVAGALLNTMNAYHHLAPSKYRNKKVTTPEGTFDSQREYKRWQELKLLERSGAISGLQRQVRYVLIPKIGKHRETAYIADFVYTENGKQVVADAKGVRTEVFRLKAKLMRWVHNIEILET